MQSTPSVFREQLAGAPAGTGETPHAEHGDEHHVHAVPLIVLAAVFVTLMVLTVITVAATEVDFGYKANLIIALGIACVKTFFVVAYFMHLRYDSLFYTAIVGISLTFIGVFVITTILDTEEYAPNVAAYPVAPAPAEAPAPEAAAPATAAPDAPAPDAPAPDAPAPDAAAPAHP